MVTDTYKEPEMEVKKRGAMVNVREGQVVH
jgi:hypothetical protein